jgi:LmbE family N-acetylglucosaminyl deacetylase
MQGLTVFLLAHQDDEFGVFFAIEEAVRRGERVVCLYLTDGGYGAQRTDRRCAESLAVLRSLGVDAADVHFLGVAEGYPDGGLYARLDDALAAVETALAPLGTPRALYMHAWEGGHQDHDAVHLIGATYAARSGLLGVSRQFTLYRAAENLLKLALFAPLAENGSVAGEPISGASRLRYLRHSLAYPSQWKTWVVLFPLLAHAYWTEPNQKTQGLSTARLLARPHAGVLLYERRGYLRYEDFRAAADAFLHRRLPRVFSLGDQG